MNTGISPTEILSNINEEGMAIINSQNIFSQKRINSALYNNFCKCPIQIMVDTFGALSAKVLKKFIHNYIIIYIYSYLN